MRLIFVVAGAVSRLAQLRIPSFIHGSLDHFLCLSLSRNDFYRFSSSEREYRESESGTRLSKEDLSLNTRSMSMIRSLFKATKSGRDNMHFLAMAMSTQAMAGCPFLAHPPNPYPGLPEPKIQREFFEAVEKTNWNDVKSDLKQLFKDSKEFWPADYGHYGGLFIRMAWHSTGTYRERYV
jgi:hypothetical protein